MLHPDVVPSVAAVDEEEGIVLLWMNFARHQFLRPGNALITFEAFKVFGKDAPEIHAVKRILPHVSEGPEAWLEFDPIPYRPPRRGPSTSDDRQIEVVEVGGCDEADNRRCHDRARIRDRIRG
jgi:hypothetical protein